MCFNTKSITGLRNGTTMVVLTNQYIYPSSEIIGAYLDCNLEKNKMVLVQWKTQVIVGYPTFSVSGVDQDVGIEHFRSCSPAIVLSFSSNKLLKKFFFFNGCESSVDPDQISGC